ncbi:alpha-D-ribose 1-methylphosphonate 5-triphosphate diphosphatase [Roseovarius indicus]|uniref:alpha-D-ribose 1-methylphosphonate 5-triphosphate diphosphatase n=1 Tax=Roseovarius indicus TaxID=540747 RepID=UPI0007D90258|nr:alpha-D-ribose 1-methylphosphonate 5-triphosphate diphosphatase [Roseovarius indicus]OAN99233.1 alpha-D-ribose 1-methylphosphonate 5-triphosphate diphosphatase [Roseovarius indicus]
MSLSLRLTGAEVLLPDGLARTDLNLTNGHVTEEAQPREVDLTGFLVLPGMVDAHGDGFEKHLAPRRGAMKNMGQGLIAAEAELAANGITTAVLAQFYSWEGGMRGPDFAERVFTGLEEVRPRLDTDLLAQLRFETPMLDDYDAMQDMVRRFAIPYVVFNDHLPHEALEKGKRPPRLTGQALRIGRNPEKHLEYMQELHARMGEVPAALAPLTRSLAAEGICMGSHDDRTSAQRADWHAMGVRIAEFPETQEAAEAARETGDGVILGAPNVVRGGSHNGNVSAIDLAAMGLCDALASDYHYPSLRRAAFLLADGGITDLAGAWSLVSAGPARLLGLTDRGTLTPGQRADLVILDATTRDICATISRGRVTHLRGAAATRFLA